MTPKQLNAFLMFKLPAAYLCGVRLKRISLEESQVSVKYRWMNQNPFNSMYFAVQSMAAELSTGAMLLNALENKEDKYSTLVVNHQGSFSKKAVGRISFTCLGKDLIEKAVQEAQETGEGVQLTLESKGIDEKGDEVSSYQFTWSIKKKAQSK